MQHLYLYYKIVSAFFKYYFRAKTKYDIHSPFVSDLIKNVVEDDRNYYAFSSIITLRERLSLNRNIIEITDYGAGSKVNPSPKRSIREIAKYSAVSPHVGKLLFRLVHWHKPKKILELGTSLAISTLYQVSAAQNAQFISIEGCPNTINYAKENLDYFKCAQVDVLQGPFAQILPKALQQLEKVDYLYLDGDHRAGASLQYFQNCLQFAHDNSLFVIADIHWSEEMESAWGEMKAHPKVRLSIDLFHIGLLFFRTEQRQKEHLTLIKSKWKPWRMGFF